MCASFTVNSHTLHWKFCVLDDTTICTGVYYLEAEDLYLSYPDSLDGTQIIVKCPSDGYHGQIVLDCHRGEVSLIENGCVKSTPFFYLYTFNCNIQIGLLYT